MHKIKILIDIAMTVLSIILLFATISNLIAKKLAFKKPASLIKGYATE